MIRRTWDRILWSAKFGMQNLERSFRAQVAGAQNIGDTKWIEPMFDFNKHYVN